MEVAEMELSSSCLSSWSGQDTDLPSLNWLQNISFAPPSNGTAPIISTLPQSQPTRLTTRAKQNHQQQPRNKTITKTSTHVTVNIDGYKINGDKKPPFSYATLICMALCRNDNKMTLAEIYQWISENFLFYHNQDKSWQKSIRHNLSLNKCFIKIARSKNEPGKGGFWSLDLKRLEESRRSKRCSTLTVRKKKAILHTKSSRKKLKTGNTCSNGKKTTPSIASPTRASTPATPPTTVTQTKKKEKKHNILSNISVCGGTEVKRKESKTISNSDSGLDSATKIVLEKPQIVPDHEYVHTPIKSPVNDPSVIETIIDNEFIFDDKFISSNGQTMIFNDVDFTTFLSENDVEWTDDNLLLLDPLFNDF